MKNIKYFIYTVLAVLTLGLVSCQEAVSVGEPDEANCYGVYFPEQAVPGEIDPSDVKSWTFTVRRTNDADDIIVPVKISDDSEVYDVEPIAFEAGQKETTFKVKYSRVETGKEYPFSLTIDDPQYYSKYSDKSIDLAFTVSVVKWNKVTKNGATKGLFRDGVVSYAFTLGLPADTEVEVEERADRPGVYRIKKPYTNAYMQTLFNDFQSSYASTLYTQNIIIDASVPNKVWMDTQEIGVNWPGYGKFVVCSNVNKCELAVTTLGGQTGDVYGTLEDGVISFPAGSLIWGFDYSLYGYVENDYFRLILPGHRVYDYSISVTTGLTEKGKGIPAKFTMAADVATIKYAVFEGKVNAFDSETQASLLGTSASVAKDVVTITKEGLYYLNMPETGEYTVIAASYDKDGNYKDFAYSNCNYLADGDNSKQVIVHGDIYTSDKYADQGVTAENSVHIYVTGKDLTDVKIGIFKEVDYKNRYDECLDFLMSSPSVDPEVLAMINSYNYSGAQPRLAPGSTYYMILYASNGYDSVIKEYSTTTEGVYNEIYSNFTKNDFLAEQPSLESYFKDWNYYAVDNFKTVGQREYLGKVTIQDSEYMPNEKTDDYIDIKGLFSTGMASIEGFKSDDDAVIFDYYKGFIYSLTNYFQPFEWEGFEVYLQTLFTTTDGRSTTGAGLLVGGFVKDGYVAFVDAGMYIDAQFNAIGLYGYTDKAMTKGLGYFVSFADILLVDPAIDNSGKADPATLTTGEINLAAHKFYSPYEGNCVETEEGRIKSIIDGIIANRGAVSSKLDFTSIIVSEAGLRASSFEAVATEDQTFNPADVTFKKNL